MVRYNNPKLSDISAYAVDLRFKYKVTDAATIAALAKYESVKVKEECETFFNSDYYDLLTSVDSRYFIDNLERVNKNAKKTI